jgi:hypothetical protein
MGDLAEFGPFLNLLFQWSSSKIRNVGWHTVHTFEGVCGSRGRSMVHHGHHDWKEKWYKGVNDDIHPCHVRVKHQAIRFGGHRHFTLAIRHGCCHRSLRFVSFRFVSFFCYYL